MHKKLKAFGKSRPFPHSLHQRPIFQIRYISKQPYTHVGYHSINTRTIMTGLWWEYSCEFVIFIFILDNNLKRMRHFLHQTMLYANTKDTNLSTLCRLRFLLLCLLLSVVQCAVHKNRLLVEFIINDYHPGGEPLQTCKGLTRNSSNIWAVVLTRNIVQHLTSVLWPLLLTWFNFNPSMDK